MVEVRKILFGTNFAEPAAAVELAVKLGSAFGAEVVFAHVQPSFWKHWLSSGLVDKQDADRLKGWADRVAAQGVRAHAAPILQGNVPEELIECAESESTDLIVVGHGQKSAVQRQIVGSTAQSIARFARQPVWVWHAPETRIAKVLCGIDGSQQSAQALAQAANVCRLLNARLTIASVLDDPTPHLLGSSSAEIEREAEQNKAERMRELDAFVQSLNLGPLGTDRRYVWGRPAAVLTALARDEPFDLLVLGRTGRGGARRVLLGGTVDRVLRSCSCSVLVTEQSTVLP